MPISRRRLLASTSASLASASLVGTSTASAADEHSRSDFRLRYMLASCMYGYMPLSEILAEVKKSARTAIDLWPRVHGNQREQLDELGEPTFASMLRKHDVSLGCITQYKLGPFGLQDEMRLANRLNCKTIVAGGKGPKGLGGSDLKSAVAEFVEKMKPHLEVAEETDVTIAIENHGNNLIESPDSLKWLVEMRPSAKLAVALAPYHLEQDSNQIAQLIQSLGNSIAVFYAWQHGMGCTKKLPKEQELLQMPGRGELDFKPILAALQNIEYSGWTEIFMHPVPRGIPILENASAVTAEINRSRQYLTKLLK